jgi:hypothetical protein
VGILSVIDAEPRTCGLVFAAGMSISRPSLTRQLFSLPIQNDVCERENAFGLRFIGTLVDRVRIANRDEIAIPIGQPSPAI